MPDTNDFHGMKNILLNNDDWMVVDPLDYNAFVYYAPEKFKGSWNQFREGDTYFVIDKNNQSNNGLVTYTIHKRMVRFNIIMPMGLLVQKWMF